MSFAETRLELGIDYGTVGGPRFSTSILVDGSGGEQRNANWGQPLGRWQIGDRKLTQFELDYFLDFHSNRKGAAEGFRFKDWTDYQASMQPIGIGNGSKTQFQLIKRYTIAAYTAIRPILKPVGGTVNIYSNGIAISSGWIADLTTGVITFANPPANGAAITADFEFDMPVRFEQDNIEFRFEAIEVATGNAIFFLQSLSVAEVRLTPDTPIPFSPVPQTIAQTLNLGYDYGTVGGPAYNTRIATIGGGHERRTSNWNKPRGRWQVGDRTLNRAELDYLIAFHRIVRGAAVEFMFNDWQRDQNTPVRFEEDSLSVRFDAYDPESGEAIFYLAGLSLVETVPFVPIGFGQGQSTATFKVFFKTTWSIDWDKNYVGEHSEISHVDHFFGPIYGARAFYHQGGVPVADPLNANPLECLIQILAHGWSIYAFGSNGLRHATPYYQSIAGTSGAIPRDYRVEIVDIQPE